MYVYVRLCTCVSVSECVCERVVVCVCMCVCSMLKKGKKEDLSLLINDHIFYCQYHHPSLSFFILFFAIENNFFVNGLRPHIQATHIELNVTVLLKLRNTIKSHDYEYA